MELKIEETTAGGETKTYVGFAGFIRSQLDYLISCRGKAPDPHVLEDDIWAYQCILDQPDPEAAAIAYKTARGNSYSRTKRAIVEELGFWK